MPKFTALGLVVMLAFLLAPGVTLADDDQSGQQSSADDQEQASADYQEQSSADDQEQENADDQEQTNGDDDKPINPYEHIESDPNLWTHGWIVLSLGGALLAAGGVTGGVALHLNNDLDSQCSAGECPPSQHDRLDRRNALATSSTALLAAGIATTAVGILVLAVFTPNRDEEPETGADQAQGTLLPLAGPHLAGAALEWRF